MGKKTFCALLWLMCAVSGFCASVSFQIVQHNDSMSSVCNSVLVIEDEILNSFFNSGYIVSNSPASMSSSAAQDKKLWNLGYSEAVEGSFEDFIQIHLYFNESTAKNTQTVALGMIDKIGWKIVSLKNGKTVEEKTKSIKKTMGADTEDNVRLFAKDFAVYIQGVLRKK